MNLTLGDQPGDVYSGIAERYIQRLASVEISLVHNIKRASCRL